MVRKSKFNYIKFFIELILFFILILYCSFYYFVKSDFAFHVSAEVATTSPGASDPAATDPAVTDPGATDPGATATGTTDPGATATGTTSPKTTDPANTPGKETTSNITDPPQGNKTPRPVQSYNGGIPSSTISRRHITTPTNSDPVIPGSNTNSNSNNKGVIVVVKIIGYIFFAASFFMAVYAVLYAVQSLFPKLIKWNIPRLDDMDSPKARKAYPLKHIMDKSKKPIFTNNSVKDGKDNMTSYSAVKKDIIKDDDDWRPLG